MPKFSVKRRFVILVAVILVIVLGFVSFTRMATDFLPNMNMPYMIVITTYPGASPEKVEADITEKVEAGVGTVNGVKNVTSNSAENASTVMLEFEDDTNMDAAMVKVSSAVNQLDLPDTAGNPMIMEISMDMMATMMTSIDYDGKQGVELSKFVEDTVIPEIERQDGVASVGSFGIVKNSVEVVLNQDKIDDVNGKVLEKTNKTLADAKKEIDDATKKLDEGQDKLKEQKKKLADEQDEKSTELAKYSKLMNQAMATKEAYNSELTSLKASRSALQMEKKAYQKNGVAKGLTQMENGIKQMRAAFEENGAGYKQVYDAVYNQVLIAMVQAGLSSVMPDVQVTAENLDTFLAQMGDGADDIKEQAKAQAKSTAGAQAAEQLSKLPKNVKDAIDSPAKLKYLKTMMESRGQKEAAKNLTKKNLKTMYDIVHTRIPQIDTALANLKIQIATAEGVVKEVNKSIAKAEAQYEQVEAGKITAAAAFGSASAQLSSAESAIESGKEELKNARKSYNESKKQALESANLDMLLTMEQLSGILTAENFSMPAGYISEDKTQYLIKVGDEYESVEQMEDAILCNIDDIGDVKLSDVADVTIVDNSDDSYAKVNGNDAVIISISKASTAGTSKVSEGCNDKMVSMQKEYGGLHFTNLMDQGDYIRLIVDSVIQNLLWGAVLAIIVLFVFLKDVRPTVVVAFSIPLSVLFSIVLMYFTDITLNIISLSGLALGIGMLVDNSIVVVENIYRLRSKGMSAARAAVMGANQVAGAIFSSTLTTISVFLPIVFTDGITRQIMQDMCLTIAYSLSASLVVALTFVPSMGATVLKNSKEKKHPWFNAVVNLYEKLIRFCLRFKPVPIVLAVALLVFSVWKVFQMGIVFMPDMGSEQMSASIVMPNDTDTADDYKIADEILGKMKDVEGVEKVGAMMGNSSAIMTGGGEGQSKTFSVMMLLKEEYANKNKEIAAEFEDILDGYNLEDYSVSDSNMDMSGMMGSGLEVYVYGKDLDKLLKISEDVKEMASGIEGFEEVTNNQEDADKQLSIHVDKDKAMRLGLTVAQVYAELSSALTTEKESITLSLDDEDYQVKIVDDRDGVDTDNIMEHVFETASKDDKGNDKKEKHKLKEFAKMVEGESLATISRENLTRRVRVSAVTKEGYNTTLLSREMQKKIDAYDAPAGYDIEISGETETNMEMVTSMLQMIALAVIFIYLIMVAQFQSLLSPFIVIFTIPLAFTGGLIALLITGQEISVMSLMGFLVLSGVVVNNGIVFVDYVNQLRFDGVTKREALVETGKTRMRPILMTALTTILAMSVMAVSNDSTAALGRGMAIVTIGGLAYATLMTLFVVPVLYDIFYRRKRMERVDLGDEETLNTSNE